MKRAFLFAILALSFGVEGKASAQNPAPSSLPPPTTTQPSAASQPSSPPTGGWRVIKQKQYPLYKVQTLTKDNRSMPLGIEGTRAVITNSKGKVAAEVKNLLIEPDPQETIEGWVSGTTLDLDKDGNEDLVLRIFTGGAHCCYSYQIFSLGPVFKKLADLKLFDCGEKIKLQDFSGDGVSEILTCNSSFTYLKDIPYSQSPFPPMVFGLEGGKFVNQDKKYPQIFSDDIAAEKKQIQQKGVALGSALQIVLDYLFLGKDKDGWAEFDRLIASSPKKESLKQDLKDRWQKYVGAPPESRPAETQAGTPSAERKLP